MEAGGEEQEQESLFYFISFTGFSLGGWWSVVTV